MHNFWNKEVPYISVFGLHHVIYIFLLIVSLSLLLYYRVEVKNYRNSFRKVLLFVSIMQQILLYSWYIFEMGFNLSESLPLHISRISSILGILFLLTERKGYLNTLFFFGLFAYASFFYPQRVYPFYHVIGISFFLNHVLTILLPIYASIVYDWRPRFSSLTKAYSWFLLYFTFVYFLNPLINGNYFYLKFRPFFGDWPDTLYIPAALSATFCLFLIGYYCANYLINKFHSR